MRSKEVNDKNKYNKEYGAGATSILHLCEGSVIKGSNRAVNADIWFGGISCVLGLSKLSLQAITMIQILTVGYCIE